jgi:hypothetical protein
MPKVEVGSLTTARGRRTAVRVAVYRRISTDEERQPFSLDAQQSGWRPMSPRNPAGP